MALVNTIPLVEYTKEELQAESKPGRTFYGKWEHSLIVFDNNQPIAIIIGYEREKEDNNQYPENSIYISELAVHKDYRRRGIAQELIKLFLRTNNYFSYLKGNVKFTVQTNSADWNQHVINLYKAFGFKEISTKEYKNRKDVILRLDQ